MAKRGPKITIKRAKFRAGLLRLGPEIDGYQVVNTRTGMVLNEVETLRVARRAADSWRKYHRKKR